MLEENIQKAYSMLLGKCTKQLKIKLKQSIGWIQASTIFDFLDLVNLINSIIFKLEVQKCLPILIHKSKTSLHTLPQGNMTNTYYFKKNNNPVSISSVLMGQLPDQDIFDIVTEDKYLG